MPQRSGEFIHVLLIQQGNFSRMTPPVFLFCLTCLCLGEIATTVRQEKRFIPANIGDDVTLKCFYDNDDVKYYWYKQTLGQRLQLISAAYKFDKNGTFHDEFKNNPRFTLEIKSGTNHLKISYVQISDSATYFCASGNSLQLEFGEGTEVDVKGSSLNIKAFVHQSAFDGIQPLGSVSCTVNTGICAGEHRVYWFKSEEHHRPKIIYTHGDRSDDGKRKTNTQMCLYNQQMKGMDHHCAVASCGHIVFGNRTKLDVQSEVNSLVLVYFLSGALTFTTTLSVLLAFLLYKINKRKSCQLTASQARFSATSTRNAQDSPDADSLHYAALSIKLPNRSRSQRNNDECVYSGLRL
uniref:Ig-like domain-containing protein n=1 Tax=Amphiprion percula TaxID=161767 RepID=A0A3P8TQJ7_AMPPE